MGFVPPDAIQWDAMVSQFIGIAQYCGVMAVSGEKQYSRMTQAPDGAHFAMERATQRLMVEMLDDGVNALYGARPQGTFAYAQRLRGITAESSALAGISAAATSAPSVLTGVSEVPVAAVTSASAVLTGKPKASVEPNWKKRYQELYAEEMAKLPSRSDYLHAVLGWQRWC